jgi:hypothetical protein
MECVCRTASGTRYPPSARLAMAELRRGRTRTRSLTIPNLRALIFPHGLGRRAPRRRENATRSRRPDTAPQRPGTVLSLFCSVLEFGPVPTRSRRTSLPGGGASEPPPSPLGMMLHVLRGVRPPPRRRDDAACPWGGQTPPQDGAACPWGGQTLRLRPPPPSMMLHASRKGLRHFHRFRGVMRLLPE